MFFSLGHGSVGAGDDEDGTIHLGRTGDHVLDVVSVTGAVHVGVVAAGGLVLDGGGVDGDTASAFLGGGVDFIVFLADAAGGGGEGHGEGGGEGGLAVVDVANCADVEVGFRALELAPGGTDCEIAAARAGGTGGGRLEAEDRRVSDKRGA